MQIHSVGQEDPLEEGMATHSSVLAWRIPMDRGAGWDLYLYCKGEIVTFIILILYIMKQKYRVVKSAAHSLS